MREGLRDIIFGIAMLVTAALLFLETTNPAYQQAGVLGYGFSPAFFPRILLIIWAALSIILIIRALPALHRRIDKPDWGKLAGAVAITLGYVGLIGVIGFAFASIVFAATFMTLPRLPAGRAGGATGADLSARHLVRLHLSPAHLIAHVALVQPVVRVPDA